ncbi:hypothetical protein ACF0H5_018878 [Mactra antiquata]
MNVFHVWVDLTHGGNTINTLIMMTLKAILITLSVICVVKSSYIDFVCDDIPMCEVSGERYVVGGDYHAKSPPNLSVQRLKFWRWDSNSTLDVTFLPNLMIIELPVVTSCSQIHIAETNGKITIRHGNEALVCMQSTAAVRTSTLTSETTRTTSTTTSTPTTLTTSTPTTSTSTTLRPTKASTKPTSLLSTKSTAITQDITMTSTSDFRISSMNRMMTSSRVSQQRNLDVGRHCEVPNEILVKTREDEGEKVGHSNDTKQARWFHHKVVDRKTNRAILTTLDNLFFVFTTC